MTRRFVLAVLLFLAAQVAPAAPAMQTGTLPVWDTSASAPLRPLPAGLRMVEYVEFTGPQIVDLGLVFTPRDKVEVDWQFTQVQTKQQRVFCQRPSQGLHVELYVNGSGVHGFAYERDNLNGWGSKNMAVTASRLIYGVDGPNKLMYSGTVRWSVANLSAMTDAECGDSSMCLGRNISATPTHARCYGCKFWKSGALVRDFRPARDESGNGCLFNVVCGEVLRSTTATPLVAGPLLVDPDEAPPALLPKSPNWYAGYLSATNPPATPAAGAIVSFDALVIPEGIHSIAADRIVLAQAPMLDAVLERYRTGLAPTNVPVRFRHDADATGRVTRVWTVAGSGLWARLEVPCDVFPDAGRCLSAEVLSLKATASDDWGAWATFCLPWQLIGVAFTDDPALPGTRYIVRDAPAGAYPDPRTTNNTWSRHR